MADQWGEVTSTRSIIQKNKNEAPRLSKIITSIPGEKKNTLVNLDLSQVIFGTQLEKPRKQGTSPFIKVYHNNNQLRFALRELPEFSKLPFDAGPYSGDGGPAGDDNAAWTVVFSLSKEEESALIALEKRFVECAMPLKDEMYPPKAGSKKSISQDAFEEKFTSRLKGGDDEKGYAAGVKVFVQHQEYSAEGQRNRVPTIWKTTLLDDGKTVTRLVRGTIQDLKAGCVAAAEIEVVRGMYRMDKTFGVKFTLANAVVITNMGDSKDSMPNLSNVNVTTDAAPEHADGDDGEDAGEGEEEPAPDLSAANP